MSYDNTNSGALFRNDRRQSDSHPEYTGTINVKGEEFWLSAWVKQTKDGKKFFSIKLREKNAAPPQPKPAAREEADIPF